MAFVSGDGSTFDILQFPSDSVANTSARMVCDLDGGTVQLPLIFDGRILSFCMAEV